MNLPTVNFQKEIQTLENIKKKKKNDQVFHPHSLW